MILNYNLYKKHGYLKGVVVSLKISFSLLFKNIFIKSKKNQIAYPESKYNYSDRSRGKHLLTLDDEDALRCTSCMLCVKYCPADCIDIVPGNVDYANNPAPPLSFEIEILRCVYCGLCQEACPANAIRLTPSIELAHHAEKNWVYDHKELSQKLLG